MPLKNLPARLSLPLFACLLLGSCATLNVSEDALLPGSHPNPPAGPPGDPGDPGTGNPGDQSPHGAYGDPVALPDQLLPDTLYAVPDFTHSHTGAASFEDALRITVASGPLTSPFQFANAVGIIVPVEARYVAGSFNVGSIGGEASEADGIWAQVAPSQGFLLAPDTFITATPVGGHLHRIDFNVTPLGGSDAAGASGALFNFGMQFAAAGIYRIGFAGMQGVQRTFYSSSAQVNEYWTDTGNDHPGVLNYVTAE
jgi:hypothetical protein